jgi:hypothetical protein
MLVEKQERRDRRVHVTHFPHQPALQTEKRGSAVTSEVATPISNTLRGRAAAASIECIVYIFEKDSSSAAIMCRQGRCFGEKETVYWECGEEEGAARLKDLYFFLVRPKSSPAALIA